MPTTANASRVTTAKKGIRNIKLVTAQKNNIMTARVLCEMIKSSLGPRGMDKMILNKVGDIKITNDGATMLWEADVGQPVAKMLVEVSRTTDREVGDGTTSAVLLTGALLDRAESLIERGIHPNTITRGYRIASKKALQYLNEISESLPPLARDWLVRVASTAMQTKFSSKQARSMADLVVSAATQVAVEGRDGRYSLDIGKIVLQKLPGGSLMDTNLIHGVVLPKDLIFSSMPKRVDGAKVAVMDVALVVRKTKNELKVTVTDPTMVKRFWDERTQVLRAMADKVISVGANVLVNVNGIDDVVATYLSNAGIPAVRHVTEGDAANLAKATGARITNGTSDISSDDLGYASLVEERQVEDKKWVFVEGCKDPKAVTILLRGANARSLDESERSIHDALMVSKDVIEHPAVVAGGGAAEAELAWRIRGWAATLDGREQLAAEEFARALEVIPLTLATNAGMDPIDAMAEVASRHATGGTRFGIEGREAEVKDMYSEYVLDPLTVKQQMIKSATEVACMLLRIDNVLLSGKK